MQPTFTASTQDATKVKKLVEYKEEQQIYNNHNAVNRALKQQIKAAVDKKYLEELSEPLVGYMNITAQNMINHLINQYGHITSSDVKEINKCMNEPMDIDELISTYFHQVEKYVQLAENAKTPYTNEQVLQCVEHATSTTGMFDQAMEEWMEKPTTSNNYKEFKKFIQKKHRFLKECLRRTAKQQEYHNANTLMESATEEIAE
eukprot:6652145-Ditylum_brightwellii.AAC.1